MEETKSPAENHAAEAADENDVSSSSISFGDKPFPTQVPSSCHKLRNKFIPAGRLRKISLEKFLFIAALVVYLLTRLFHISDFPIYFFTDEAVQTVLAADLVRDGFYSYDHELLPTFFYNGYQYNLSTSVYLQVLPYMIFGKSIPLTRGLAACTTLLAAAAVGLIIQKVYKFPHAWGAVLLLSITPAWFLHSRTAFETGLAVTFFALFLYFYLMYRTTSAGYLYLAVAAGALSFYSYSPARVVICAAAVLLFISDLRYHIQHRKTVLFSLALILLVAIPLLRFTIQHPTAVQDHLRILDSYWVEPIPFLEKVGSFFREYLHGLNPFYWYFPNQVDMDRHLMKGYGHVLWATMPFMLVGLGVAVSKIKKTEYRALLIALLAAPAGAALVALGITRALFMVIPLALLSGLGLSWTIEQISSLAPQLRKWLPGVIFGMLCLINVMMTWDALKNSPLWVQDYGLAGMQWGAKQLFSTVGEYIEQHPDDELIVSPAWGNGTDTTARFFFYPTPPFQMGSIAGYFNEKKALDDQTLFVMIPSEYKLMLESGKFTDIRVEKIIEYPNGEPGFLFVRLRYIDNIDQILAAERKARRVLQESSLEMGSEVWQVKYSYLDLGSIENAFDGDPNSLLRTMEANPLVVEIDFPNPRSVHSVQVKVGGPPAVVDLYFTDINGEVIPFTRTIVETPSPRNVLFDLEEEITATRLRIEVNSVRDQEPAHVHLWEIGIE
ncbi:MAG: glycosyltransferase family 39 protein [Chloroflexi bacterium]|nr:glycosyltransferase family 39 protein [Chloroflexota bacterium]